MTPGTIISEQESHDKSQCSEKNEDDKEDKIAQLVEMESQDMQHWQQILMPPGTKCMIIVGLTVAPAFYRRGVGNALMKWETDVADKLRGFYVGAFFGACLEIL